MLHLLVWWALSDATSDWESASDTGEIGIDVAGGHAAFVDTPNDERLTL